MDYVKKANNNYYNNLKGLFELARKNGGIDYIYTLLRMNGFSNEKDHFLVAKRNQYNPYREPLSEQFLKDILVLLANLFFCASNKPFRVDPFFHKYIGQFPNIKEPSLETMINELDFMAASFNKAELLNIVKVVKASNLIAVGNEKPEHRKEANRFIDSLLRCYFLERKNYKKIDTLNKLSRFEVLELMIDESYGLYGFKIHFSNGSHAMYRRTENLSMPMNILLEKIPINFFAGDLNGLKNEWMVGSKKLYEIGISGRYNKIGEWMPIVFPGSVDEIDRMCHEMVKDDDEVRGSLFYIMSTGHRGIEFVTKTPIELPMEGIRLGDKMHLWKCKPLSENSHANSGFVIYDGHYELDEIDPKSIRTAIASINVGLNRLAFAYGSSIEWCLKYRSVARHALPQPTPSKKDLEIFNSLLVDFPKSEDAIILDIAIDWYHRGNLVKSKNPFIAFLCYYIALETVAISVADGDADLGLNFEKENKSDKQKRILEEVKKKHDEGFEKDPIKFIREGYFEYVIGLKEKTRKVSEIVFGKDHKYVKILFESNENQKSLYDLRGNIAHGSITLLNNDDRNLIEGRLHEMNDIVKNFLKKVIFILKPGDKIPSWSNRFKHSIFTADPRDTHVVSDIKMFPNKDWRIKSEWLD